MQCHKVFWHVVDLLPSYTYLATVVVIPELLRVDYILMDV